MSVLAVRAFSKYSKAQWLHRCSKAFEYIFECGFIGYLFRIEYFTVNLLDIKNVVLNIQRIIEYFRKHNKLFW